MLDTFRFIDDHFSPGRHYKVDQFVYGLGLVVNNSYRGRGISTEILKARAPLLKEIGLEVTTTIFTGICSQRAAQSAGYEENFAISFVELQEKFPLLDFSHANTTHCKILSLKIDP